MRWFEWLVLGSGILLEFSVIAQLLRWRVWRSFPVYSIYIVFVLCRDLATVVTVSHPGTYFFVYWLSAPVDILLTTLATLESFWRVFRSFHLFRWFRFALPVAIAVALAYSSWRGYRFPPVEATPVDAAIIQSAVASHYVILSIAILFFLLAALLHVSWRIHEHRLILGFGVASLAFVFGGSVRAVFGSHFDWISQQVPPIGYQVALLIWLSAAVHPVPENHRLAAPPVENLDNVKFQLRNVRSFVRKDTR